MKKRLWFVVTVISTDGKYRAICFHREENENLIDVAKSYYAADKHIPITLNCWPKSKCEKIADEWNEQFRREGRFYDLA